MSRKRPEGGEDKAGKQSIYPRGVRGVIGLLNAMGVRRPGYDVPEGRPVFNFPHSNDKRRGRTHD